jgi:hypothetical protein
VHVTCEANPIHSSFSNILLLILALVLSLHSLVMISTTVFAVLLSAIWMPSIYADSVSVYANDTNLQLVNFISS